MASVLLARYFINMPNRSSPHVVWLGLGIYQLKWLQCDWAPHFPNFKKCSANNFRIDLLVSNSHGPFTYILSMRLPHKEIPDTTRKPVVILFYLHPGVYKLLFSSLSSLFRKNNKFWRAAWQNIMLKKGKKEAISSSL